MSDLLTLKFDPNTIENLGIELYSKLPSVLSELVSNSWDADAHKLTISFIDQSLSIREVARIESFPDGFFFEGVEQLLSNKLVM